MGIWLVLTDVIEWLGRSGQDITVNLIAAGIGGAAVWVAGWTRQRTRLWRTRRFWKDMGDRGITVVFGVQDRGELDRWEPSGLIGLGGLNAIFSIKEQLQSFGFNPTIRSAKEMSSTEMQRDLVLIGGPDANAVTAQIIERIERKMTLGFPFWRQHIVTLVDRINNKHYQSEDDEEGRISADYGMVIRAPNPLARGKEVVILAGCRGYGTVAAAEALQDRVLHRREVSTRRPFEALVKVVVVNGRNYTVTVLDVRALQEKR